MSLIDKKNRTGFHNAYGSMLRRENFLLEALLIEIENVTILGVESVRTVRQGQEGDETELSEKNHGYEFDEDRYTELKLAIIRHRGDGGGD